MISLRRSFDRLVAGMNIVEVMRVIPKFYYGKVQISILGNSQDLPLRYRFRFSNGSLLSAVFYYETLTLVFDGEMNLTEFDYVPEG